MAKSKWEYVKGFEQEEILLPGCWIVIRLDGHSFTRFAKGHDFVKPNDVQALALMDHAAQQVMKEFGDIRMAFGESDEMSFILNKASTLYGRRKSKLISLIVSCFTAHYIHSWGSFFPTKQLQHLPIFDGRAVCYPSDRTLRDYLSWRQADTHINNQYNTCFWSLVKSGLTGAEAQDTLKHTQADFKNELLHSKFGINYSKLDPRLRKGSIIIRQGKRKADEAGQPTQADCLAADSVVVVAPAASKGLEVLHVDLIQEGFWTSHPEILR
ncbi:hypothetical protein WJX84_003746 [Apatococcus fuscideae]|uniref:tRNA(His) guanylyltransferase n=1 Tax=Apatococcus fuscideae TaxID=2026836 RepID=A0AAW1T360_9CHLO